MSTVIKCDMCGNVTSYVGSNVVKIRKRTDSFGGRRTLNDLDICDECYRNIIKFIGLDERKE